MAESVAESVSESVSVVSEAAVQDERQWPAGQGEHVRQERRHGNMRQHTEMHNTEMHNTEMHNS